MSYRSNEGFGIVWKAALIVLVVLVGYTAWEVREFAKNLSQVIESQKP